MSHAERFNSVQAQKGTPLAGIVGAMKGVADLVEESYDAGSPQVVGAMQRFEMGLNLLRGAPERAGDGGPAKPKKARTRRSPTPKSEDDSQNVGDTPSGASSEESPEGSS